MLGVKKQIFGVSDSASLFSQPWEDPIYFRQMASLTGKTRPEIVYVGAARGDDSQRVAEFYRLSHRIEFRPRVLSFFDMVTDDPYEYFAGADIIYIDGGSSKNLLAILGAWNAVNALKDAYDRGVVIAGASAGISVLFDWFITDSVKTKILPHQGMGFLKGTVCVHHNIRADRRDVFHSFLNSKGAAFPAFALDDSVAIHFVNGELESAYKLSEAADFRVLINNAGAFPAQQPILLSKTIHTNAGTNGIG